MRLEMDKVKENQSARNLQGKAGGGGVSAPDREQSTRREKWEI
jgi:hypothetical protein